MSTVLPMGREGDARVGLKKAVRFHVERDGVLRRLFNLSWSERDASLYIHLQGANRESFAGLERAIAEPSWTLDFTSQFRAKGVLPYLSLHESGQVHAHCGLNRTSPIGGPPLVEGDHVASVACFDVSSLPLYEREPQGAPRADVILQPRDTYLSKVVVAIFTSTDGSRLPASSKFFISMARESVGTLEVGLTVRGEDAGPTIGDQGGVLAMAGWGAATRVGEPHDLVWAVAK